MIWSADHRTLFALLERLAHEPKSLWRAQQVGDESLFGYDRANVRLDDLVDLLAVFFAQFKASISTEPVEAPAPVERPGAASSQTDGGEGTEDDLDDLMTWFTR